MYESAIPSRPEILNLPTYPGAPRKFWLSLLLLLALVISASLAAHVFLVQATRNQDATLTQRIDTIKQEITRTQQHLRQTLEAELESNVVAQARARLQQDAGLLKFAATPPVAAARIQQLSRQDQQFALQGLVMRRNDVAALLHHLQTTELVANPVLTRLAANTQSSAVPLQFHLSGQMPQTTAELKADKTTSRRVKENHETDTASTADDSSLLREQGWIVFYLILFGVFLLGLMFAHRSLQRQEQSAVARLYFVLERLDPWRIETWPLAIRILALLEFTLTIAFLSWLFIIFPAFEAHEASESQKNSLIILTKEREHVKKVTQEAEHRLANAQAQSTQKLATKPADLDMLRQQLAALAQQHQLRLTLLTGAAGDANSQSPQLLLGRYELRGQGSAIAAFLHSLEHLPSPVLLGNFAWFASTASASPVQLQGEFLTATLPAEKPKNKKKKGK